jgi:hypothetical protein
MHNSRAALIGGLVLGLAAAAARAGDVYFEDFTSPAWITPECWSGGAVDISSTGWTSNFDPTAANVTNHFLPMNSVYVFGGAIGDTNGDGLVDDDDWLSKKGTLGLFRTAGGDTAFVSLQLTNNTPSTISNWRLTWTTEAWINRMPDQDRVERLTVLFNGVELGSSDYFKTGASSFDEGITIDDGLPENNFYIDGTQNSAITSINFDTGPVAPGDTITLTFQLDPNDPSNPRGRHIGLGIGSIELSSPDLP